MPIPAAFLPYSAAFLLGNDANLRPTAADTAVYPIILRNTTADHSGNSPHLR